MDASHQMRPTTNNVISTQLIASVSKLNERGSEKKVHFELFDERHCRAMMAWRLFKLQQT